MTRTMVNLEQLKTMSKEELIDFIIRQDKYKTLLVLAMIHHNQKYYQLNNNNNHEGVTPDSADAEGSEG